jgi:hypothetical protein
MGPSKGRKQQGNVLGQPDYRLRRVFGMLDQQDDSTERPEVGICIRRAPRNIAKKGSLDLARRRTCYRHRDQRVDVPWSLRGDGQRALVIRQVDFVIWILVVPGGCHTRLKITNRLSMETVGVSAGVTKDEMGFPVFIAKKHRMGMTHGCEDYGQRGNTPSPTEEGRQSY